MLKNFLIRKIQKLQKNKYGKQDGTAFLRRHNDFWQLLDIYLYYKKNNK